MGRDSRTRNAATPSQTIGPFFSMKVEPVSLLPDADAPAARIRVLGHVLDGDQRPVEDAMVEVWQANAHGRYHHPADRRADLPLVETFTGYGRAHSTFEDGTYTFDTVRPGRVPDPNGADQAPHLCLIVTARGLLKHCHTRLYFADETDANDQDLILTMVPIRRRRTLIAALVESTPVPTYRFDIRLQGDDETVFFDL